MQTTTETTFSSTDVASTPYSVSKVFKRYIPAIATSMVRAIIGVVGLTIIAVLAINASGGNNYVPVLVLFWSAWLVATKLTDKYIHKYPYRYYSYLIASHVKSALVMGGVLGVAILVVDIFQAQASLILSVFACAMLVDFVVAVPRRERPLDKEYDHKVLASREVGGQADLTVDASASAHFRNGTHQTFKEVAHGVHNAVVKQMRQTISGFHDKMSVRVISDRKAASTGTEPVELLISDVRINDVRRINAFLIKHTEHLAMGGYFIGSYQPLESKRAAIRQRYGSGAFWPVFLMSFLWSRIWPKVPFLNRLYFLVTQGTNRHLSKAEVWGRLSFCGLHVISEVEEEGLRHIIAQRVGTPITNRKPSYYPIIGLNKIGLDGQVLKTHKLRSMYPFSEFLQKQIFEQNGLAESGKFKNDFRLTEYGPFIRRYWLDEVPQLFDWLCGDIKLVGIRPTSPHFLSLYPKSFVDLYIKVKPGFISPIFGDDGFDRIVEIERIYLERYLEAPFRTDVSLFINTFKDIVFRGVRSK